MNNSLDKFNMSLFAVVGSQLVVVIQSGAC